MVRTRKVLKQFNKKVEQDDSLEALAKTLEYLQGPQLVSMKNPKEFDLEMNHFKKNHFTNDRRGKAIEARVKALMDDDLDEVRAMIEHIASDKVKEVISPESHPELLLIHDIQRLLQKLPTIKSDTEISLINETLWLYDQILDQIKPNHELYNEIQQKRENLQALKEKIEKILGEGEEIIETVRSEIHRRLIYHAVFILMAAITVAAGVMLLDPQHLLIGNGLVLGSSSLNVLYILFDKMVSQKSFYKMDRYLQNLLEKKSEPSVE